MSVAAIMYALGALTTLFRAILLLMGYARSRSGLCFTGLRYPTC